MRRKSYDSLPMGKNDAVRRSNTMDVSFNPQYRRPCGERRMADNSVNDKFTKNKASTIKQQIINTRLCVNQMLDFNGYNTATALSLEEKKKYSKKKAMIDLQTHQNDCPHRNGNT